MLGFDDAAASAAAAVLLPETVLEETVTLEATSGSAVSRRLFVGKQIPAGLYLATIEGSFTLLEGAASSNTYMLASANSGGYDGYWGFLNCSTSGADTAFERGLNLGQKGLLFVPSQGVTITDRDTAANFYCSITNPRAGQVYEVTVAFRLKRLI